MKNQTSETPVNRLVMLGYLLAYCKSVRGYFTPGERILINQERGQLLKDYDFENCPVENPNFRYPGQLQNKINFVVRKVTEAGWSPMN